MSGATRTRSPPARARCGWSTPRATSSRASRASPRSIRPPTIPIGNDAQGISLGVQLAWVANTGDDTVQRIDRAQAQTVGDPIGVGDHPLGIFVGSEVWVTNFRDGTLSRIDIATAQVEGEPLPVGDGPRGVTEGFGAVWVSNTATTTRSRASNPTTFEVEKQIKVGERAEGARRRRSGFVWVVNSQSNTVSRIDPRTNRVAGAPIAVGQNPIGITATKGALWVDQLRRRHRLPRSTPRPDRPWTPSVFFDYPTLGPAAAAPRARDAGFLPGATEEEWDAVLAPTETLRFHPGDVVLRAGERDRAFYLLLDGRLEVERPAPRCVAPAVLGVAAFLDARPRAVTLLARTHGELARMSWDAYEALAARDPRLGRTVLVDLARGLAARLRAAGPGAAGLDGLSAMTAFPNYTQIPTRLPRRRLAGDPRRDAARARSASRWRSSLVPDDGLFVLWKLVIPALPLLWLVAPGPVAQRLPAVVLEPDAARARARRGR